MLTANRLSLVFLTLGLSLFGLTAQAATLRLIPQPSITTMQSQAIAQQRRRKRFVLTLLKLSPHSLFASGSKLFCVSLFWEVVACY